MASMMRKSGTIMSLDCPGMLNAHRTIIRWLGFALVEAGADTTSVYFQFFILMMTAFPEVRKRAQQEIDDVIGPNRLPMLEDFENLPYVNAVVNEVRLSRSEISF